MARTPLRITPQRPEPAPTQPGGESAIPPGQQGIYDPNKPEDVIPGGIAGANRTPDTNMPPTMLPGQTTYAPPSAGDTALSPGLAGQIGRDLQQAAAAQAGMAGAQQWDELFQQSLYSQAQHAAIEPYDPVDWAARREHLNTVDKGILDTATANMDMRNLSREGLKLRLQQIGLLEDEAQNLLNKLGLQRSGIGTEGQRLDLQTASLQGATEYLKQTLTDVNLDEAALGRQGLNLADQISMTDLQKEEIGYQKEDLSDYDTLAEDLLAARETLLGEEARIGEEEFGLQRKALANEQAATELQADRSMRAALRDAYSRGASFTTGIREDVADLGVSRDLALDDIALRRSGVDLSSQQLGAATDFQQVQIDAERGRAEIDLDRGLRALGMDEAEVGYLAASIGRSQSDVVDAITRLDTNRMAVQLEIADQARALKGVALDENDLADRLKGIGYDEEDVRLTMVAHNLARQAVGHEVDAADIEDTLADIQLEQALAEVDLRRTGLSEEQTALAYRRQQWRDTGTAMTDYQQAQLYGDPDVADDFGLLNARTGMNQAQARLDAMNQWGPFLAQLTQGEADRLTGAFPGVFDRVAEGASETSGYHPVQDTNITVEPPIIPPYVFPPGWDPGGGDGDGDGDEPPQEGPPGTPLPEDEDPDDGPKKKPPESDPPIIPKPGPPGPGGPLPEDGTPEGGTPEGGDGDGPRQEGPPGAPLPEIPPRRPPEYPVPENPFPPDFFPGPGGVPRTSTTGTDLSDQVGGAIDAFVGAFGGRETTGVPRQDFAADVLAGIGAPVTEENLATMALWQSMEGTGAENNPLATTWGASQGYDPYNQNKPTPVWNYPDYSTGVQNTVNTLNLGHYDPLVQGLQQGLDAATLNMIPGVQDALGTWSGQGYNEFANAGDPGWLAGLEGELGFIGAAVAASGIDMNVDHVANSSLTRQTTAAPQYAGPRFGPPR